MEYPAYDDYQPSRYDISFNLPSDWQEKRLKFIAWTSQGLLDTF